LKFFRLCYFTGNGPVTGGVCVASSGPKWIYGQETRKSSMSAESPKWKRWGLYALMAVFAVMAFMVNGESRLGKERSVRYNECVKSGKGTPEECVKLVTQAMKIGGK
jgi:hypothetical protein